MNTENDSDVADTSLRLLKELMFEMEEEHDDDFSLAEQDTTKYAVSRFLREGSATYGPCPTPETIEKLLADACGEFEDGTTDNPKSQFNQIINRILFLEKSIRGINS